MLLRVHFVVDSIASALTKISNKHLGLIHLNACLVLKQSSCICLDTHMLYRVYKGNGIGVRNHCGAEPPGDIESPGLDTTVGWRDRASTAHATADRVKAPASVARGRVRDIHRGRPT